MSPTVRNSFHIVRHLTLLALALSCAVILGCRTRNDDEIIATLPNNLSLLGQRVVKALSPTVTFVEINVDLPKPDRVPPEDRVFLAVSRLTSDGVERVVELLQPVPSRPLLAGVELDAAGGNLRLFWVTESAYLVGEAALELPEDITASARRGYLAESLGEITPVVALAVSSDLVLPSLPSFRSSDDLETFATTLTDRQTVYVAYIHGLSSSR